MPTDKKFISKGDSLSHPYNAGNRAIPKTSVVLNRSIEIVINGKPIGFIQNFTSTEARSMHKIFNHGSEEAVTICPGTLKTTTLKIKRMLLYNSRILDLVSTLSSNNTNIQQYKDTQDSQPGAVSLLDFSIPFDIVVMMRRPLQSYVTSDKKNDTNPSSNITMRDGDIIKPQTDKGVVVLETYHECWFNQLQFSIDVEKPFTILEDADVEYTWKTGTPLYPNS